MDTKTDLTDIPWIGKKMAKYMIDAGYPNIDSLKGVDPEEIYKRDCLVKGYTEDRCALYVYRFAVAYANNEIDHPDKRNWWYWKDKE